MTSPTLILLDLGGVVFQSTGVSNARIDWTTISQLNHKYGHDLNIGKDVYPDFLAEYNALTAQSLSPDGFLKEVFDTLEINTQLIELAGKYGDIVIVSDNYRENIAYISERYRFSDWATRQIYSFDYELVKADHGFFARLLQEIDGYTPDQMILIDDSPEKIASAGRHGIRGILYRSNEEVKQQLEALI